MQNLIFIDIETVRFKQSWTDLDIDFQELWTQKHQYLKTELSAAETFEDRAGIYAEFGKIICISIGIQHKGAFKLKSIYNHNEHQLLTEFIHVIHELFEQKTYQFCGHNIKEFDIPYICRRLIVNNLPLPSVFNIAGKKPWEITHIDTLELWKFGDYKHFTSLKLLCKLLSIPTPKDDISGAEVGKVYWNTQDLVRIKQYCEKDVVATARLYQRLTQQSLIKTENIHWSA